MLCQCSSILFRWLTALNILNHCKQICWVGYTFLLSNKKSRIPAVGCWSEQLLSCGNISLCWNLTLIIYWRCLKENAVFIPVCKWVFLSGHSQSQWGDEGPHCTWTHAEMILCVCSRCRAQAVGNRLSCLQNLWTKWLPWGSSGCCTLPCTAAPPTGRRWVCAAAPALRLARPAGESVNAGEWYTVGIGSMLP